MQAADLGPINYELEWYILSTGILYKVIPQNNALSENVYVIITIYNYFFIACV